jgi:hypothetical protein
VSTPKRIQRKRTKGWRMPEGAVYVGRPSLWGNPYKPGHNWHGGKMTATQAIDAYREYITEALFISPNRLGDELSALRGKDLVCWCQLDRPCHADVLLELANHD